MCFSAEASFTAAAFLTLTGIVSLRIAPKTFTLVACIPLLFALQQIAEGFLWINLSKTSQDPNYISLAKDVFLAIAFLIWPIWIPLSFFMVEKVLWRGFFLIAITLAGVLWSAYFLYILPDHEISVRIANHSIQYEANISYEGLYYIAIILLSCFVSSLRALWFFGVLVSIALIISYYFYTETMVSVWCFFAALLSVAIYFLLKHERSSTHA